MGLGHIGWPKVYYVRGLLFRRVGPKGIASTLDGVLYSMAAHLDMGYVPTKYGVLRSWQHVEWLNFLVTNE